MTVYYPDTHAPYTRHKDVDSSRFSADELGNYDTELAWTDQQLAALTGLLRARGRRWNDTIIVITADHGEEFGEHGGTQHAHTCHVESTHVPLLVRIPGIAPGRVDAPVGLVDVVPTLLELVGSTERSAELSGQSLLVPALTPDRLDRGRPVLCSIASISDKHGTFFRRAVRQGNFALFEEVNEQRLSLFDTEADPGEKVDLIDDPALAAQVATLDAILDASRTGNLADHTQMK